MAALVAGGLLRGFFVWHHPRFVGDTLVYGDLAHNLLAHHVYGLTEDRIRPTLIRLPGYPLFLAACFALFGTARYLPVVFVQVALDLLSCLLLSDLAGRSFGQRARTVTLWLAALCPFTANYTAAALTETPSIFCVGLALWAFARWGISSREKSLGTRWAVLTGLALTGAAFLRPDGILLAGAVLPVMAWCVLRAKPSRRRTLFGETLLACALLGAPLGLWTVRNWRVFHVLQPLAPKYANDPGEPAPLGFARWYRTWSTGYGDTVNVYWTYDGSPLNLRDLPVWAFDSPAQRAKTADLYARYNEESASTPPVEAAFAQLAAERVRAHPVRFYLLLPMARLADMWLRPRTELMKLPIDWWRIGAHPRRSLLQITYAGLNLVLLWLALVGLRRWRSARWSGAAPLAFAALALVLLRSALLLTIDNSEPRYTLECYPVVLLLVAFALAGRRRSPNGGNPRSRTGLASERSR